MGPEADALRAEVRAFMYGILARHWRLRSG